MKKYKRKFIIAIVVVLLTEIVHCLFYMNYALDRSQKYVDNFSKLAVDYTIQKKGYYLSLIPYDDLSLAYRIAIDENAFKNADTDEKCLEIYNCVINHTISQKSSSFYSTKGMKNGECYEELVVNGVRYKVTHNIDVKTNYFTFESYISKWMIKIEKMT